MQAGAPLPNQSFWIWLRLSRVPLFLLPNTKPHSALHSALKPKYPHSPCVSPPSYICTPEKKQSLTAIIYPIKESKAALFTVDRPNKCLLLSLHIPIPIPTFTASPFIQSKGEKVENRGTHHFVTEPNLSGKNLSCNFWPFDASTCIPSNPSEQVLIWTEKGIEINHK